MKVFIVGVAGRTGRRLARQLIARGDTVQGLYRRKSQAKALESDGVRAELGDLAEMDATKLAAAMQGSDVLVFTAGAGDSDSDAMTDAVDGDGVTKSIGAAHLAFIKRFYLVSVFPEAGRGQPVDENFENYMRVKKRTEIELVQSDLDWVIIRPSSLLDDPGTGEVSLGLAQPHTVVRRDDVAATIAELIRTPVISRTILELTEGETPIAAAVAALAP